MLLTFPCSGGFQSEIEIMVPWALEKGAQETFSCAVHNLVSIIAGLICDKLLKKVEVIYVHMLPMRYARSQSPYFLRPSGYL